MSDTITALVDQTVELAEIIRNNSDGGSCLSIAEAIIFAGYRKAPA